MSPYTSDDVLAKWVDKGVNAKLGSTIGGAVASEGARFAAKQALGAVPVVGLFAGVAGDAIGDAAGREIAIQMAGGWEYIRENSDLSFDQINDMAVWMYATHSQDENYGKVLEMVSEIYPDLKTNYHAYLLAAPTRPPGSENERAPSRSTDATNASKAVASTEDKTERLVFFDVQIAERLKPLQPFKGLYTNVIATELADLPNLVVVDRDSRDTLLKARKLRSDDCKKSECRFAMAKTLTSVHYMLETAVEPSAKQCMVTMRLNSLRTGRVENSQSHTTPCEETAVMKAIQTSARQIWPRGNKALAASQATSPSAEAPQRTRTGKLKVETFNGSYGVVIRQDGVDYACPALVEKDKPCELGGVEGPATLVVTGSESYTEQIELPKGNKELTLFRRGGQAAAILGAFALSGGVVLLVTSIALGDDDFTPVGVTYGVAGTAIGAWAIYYAVKQKNKKLWRAQTVAQDDSLPMGRSVLAYRPYTPRLEPDLVVFKTSTSTGLGAQLRF